MDKEQDFLGPEEMSAGNECWMHPSAVGIENIWGPFGERRRSKDGPGTKEKGGIFDDDHHLKSVLIRSFIL